jgi:uncharacterized Fe-S cluster-containing radical SAM superfamily protein
MKGEKLLSLGNKILRSLSSLIYLEDKDANSLTYQSDYAYLMADPRIYFIKQILKMIFIRGISSTTPFAFRLKRLKDWLIKTSSMNLLVQLSWSCRANCIFCYQKGNPPFMRAKKRISKEEMNTRLKYFDFKRGLGLMGGGICENDEILTNPYFPEAIKSLRKKNKHEIIEMTTNGTSLTPQMIKTLAKANPLLLVLSLNSADPKIRKWLMNDPHPEIAISSLPLLKKHKIPFIISLVVWPGLPFSDIEKTIRYADENDAYAVRLCLPGYTELFSKKTLFDKNEYWGKTTKYFYPLSPKYTVPLLIVPNMFVQSLLYERVDLPKVIGAIKDSPAYDHGIKPGDLILEINGQSIDSIEAAMKTLIANLYQKVRIKIKRKDLVIDLEIIDKIKGCYPYGIRELRQNAPYGFLLTERYLSHDDVKDIGRHISVYDSKRVLVLASAGTRPFVEYLLRKYNISKTSGANIYIRVPRSRYFGGSIDAGDLLIVEDFIECIKQNLKIVKPDLIILPASPFSKWGRDLIGQVNLDVEREVGIPVEFIYNSSIELA